MPGFTLGSIWEYKCFDQYGNLKWEGIDHNLVTTEGFNALLNIMFYSTSKISAWYMLLYSASATPADTMTYAAPGITECTTYTTVGGSVRASFNTATASSKAITNSADASTNKRFSFASGPVIIYGGALVGGGTAPSTLGNTTGGGTLYCLSNFTASQTIQSGQYIDVTVTITGANV